MDASKFDLSAWENDGRVVRTFRVTPESVVRTNGCAALFTRGEVPPIGCDPAPPDFAKQLSSWVDEHGAVRSTKLRDRIVKALPDPIVLPPPEKQPCAECDGKGKVQCGCCDGCGFISCNSSRCTLDHRCDGCDGDGERDCENCENVADPAPPLRAIVVAGIPVDVVYLAPLRAMGAVSLCISGHSRYEAIVFNDGDTTLAVMRMTHASDSEIVARVSWPAAKVIP